MLVIVYGTSRLRVLGTVWQQRHRNGVVGRAAQHQHADNAACIARQYRIQVVGDAHRS